MVLQGWQLSWDAGHGFLQEFGVYSGGDFCIYPMDVSEHVKDGYDNSGVFVLVFVA